MAKANRRRHTADFVDRTVRSRIMRAVKQRDTAPELAVREMLTRLGVRYRVKNRDLPGSPDIANRTRKWAIQVHGCYWHGHRNCAKTKGGSEGRIPVANRTFWAAKIASNRERDRRKAAELRARGFRLLVVWECELRYRRKLGRRLERFLSAGKDSER